MIMNYHGGGRGGGKSTDAVTKLREYLANDMPAVMMVPTKEAKDRFLEHHPDIPQHAVWVGRLDWATAEPPPTCEGPYCELWDDPDYGPQESFLCTRSDSQSRCASQDCPERCE